MLEITDNLLSLELSRDDRHLAAARESRGLALWSLHRRDEGQEQFELAFQAFAALKDAGGIERTTRLLGDGHVWRGTLEEARQVYRRGLAHLPSSAVAASIAIRARIITPLCALLYFDEADAEVQDMHRAAAGLGDNRLTAQVLTAEAFPHRSVANFESQLRCSSRALELLPPAAELQRVDAGWDHAYAHYYCGHLDEAEAVNAWVEAGAKRIGHVGALWAGSLLGINLRLTRSGDLTAAIADYTRITNERWDFVNQLLTGIFNAYLGQTEAAITGLKTAATLPARNYLAGPADAALFAALALSGDDVAARAHLDAARAWLPTDARFNSQGRWSAAMTVISGLAWLGDRGQLAELDGLGRRLAALHIPVDHLGLGPRSSELCAGLTAAAAGDATRAEQHYEEALRLSREIPVRLLEPTVQYWYGCLDLEQGRTDSGRTRLQAAIAGFTALKMPLHLARATRAPG